MLGEEAEQKQSSSFVVCSYLISSLCGEETGHQTVGPEFSVVLKCPHPLSLSLSLCLSSLSLFVALRQDRKSGLVLLIALVDFFCKLRSVFC